MTLNTDEDESDNSNRTELSDRITTPEERNLLKYLDSFLETPPFPRVVCCKTSQSLYCKECCRLLVPDGSLPVPIGLRKSLASENRNVVDFSEGRPLKLPFNLHIILDDRRGSATGIHAVSLLNEKEGIDCSEGQDSSQTGHNADNTYSSNDSLGAVKLIDVTKNDEIPKYHPGDATTFLLFPSPGESVPLESVASKVQTLVVVDCKWTKSTICRKNEQLSRLPRVHLSTSPLSHYWRWHNAGPGMISTIEAIFYAAFEVSQHKMQRTLESNQSSQVGSSTDLIDQNNLMHLVWLFGHQRAATFKAAKNEGIPPPCSDEAKERKRESRKQRGTWRQLRHEEDERIRRINEKNKRLNEEKK
ncbi:hypothetical protein ACHAXR_003516 [Thalassiosira sp. AJA248-18]